ncbi:hypothetical protein GN156_07350 [bacterium LRH843]|nr:hypothetical protein [bacterium LRH843]
MNNKIIWTIVGIFLVGLIVYLTIIAAVKVFWLVGGGIIGLIVVLVILGILTNGVGLGTIVTVLVILLLLQMIV